MRDPRSDWWDDGDDSPAPGIPPFAGRRGRRGGPRDLMFVGGGPFGRPFPRGPRAARGDIRNAILALLRESPMHGYQIMQELEQRSHGTWKPSPGSVYPTIQSLEDEGLVASTPTDGKRVVVLTDVGRAYVDEHAASIGTPWDDVANDTGASFRTLRGLVGQVIGATHQVAQAGTPAQIEAAGKILGDTRRQLYQILAADEAAQEDRP